METSQCVPRWETAGECDEVEELRWENGSLAKHGLTQPHNIVIKPIPKPFSPVTVTGTLEAVVDEAARVLTAPHGAGAGAQFLAADALVPSDSGPLGYCASLGSAAPEDGGGGFTTTASASLEDTTDYVSSGGRGGPQLEREEEEEEQEEEKGRASVSTGKRRRVAADHNLSEQRRRCRINERMKTLQKMLPNSSKIDKASLLDEVIAYIKQLQAHIQMMSRMSCNIPAAMMMPMYMQHQHLPMTNMVQMAQMSQMVQMGIAMAMGSIDRLGKPAMWVACLHPPACLPICSAPNVWMQNNGSMMQQPMSLEAYTKMATLYQQLYQRSTGQQPQYPV